MEETHSTELLRVSDEGLAVTLGFFVRSRLCSWVHALPQMLEKHGLEVVAEDKHHNPDYYQPIAAQTVLLGLAEYLYMNPSAELYQEELAKEHAGGTFVDVTWSVVVGRKGPVM